MKIDLTMIIEEYNRKCKENPRHPIELMADEDGFLRLFFAVDTFHPYLRGEAVIASTERILPTDLVHRVHKDRIEKLTDGGTLAHTRALN